MIRAAAIALLCMIAAGALFAMGPIVMWSHTEKLMRFGVVAVAFVGVLAMIFGAALAIGIACWVRA